VRTRSAPAGSCWRAENTARPPLRPAAPESSATDSRRPRASTIQRGRSAAAPDSRPGARHAVSALRVVSVPTASGRTRTPAAAPFEKTACRRSRPLPIRRTRAKSSSRSWAESETAGMRRGRSPGPKSRGRLGRKKRLSACHQNHNGMSLDCVARGIRNPAFFA